SELDTTVFEEYMWTAYRSLKNWNYRYDREEIAATLYQFWWTNLYRSIWEDEFDVNYPLDWPSIATTVQILRDSSEFYFYQKTGSPTNFDRRRLINEAFDRLVGELSQEFPDQKDWNWGERKTTNVTHLTRVLKPFSRTGIITDGIGHVLNATTQTHGPSWRMIVELGDTPKAYGVYPGGQSGNPGNPGYDAFIEKWSVGEYFQLWRMSSVRDESQDIRGRIAMQGTR
ncbi:MAG: penicillin acylase family protein, partial [Bacteroidia bacterium]|nr:penicillin acylase family protein [Bacteroidia bacterium]